MNRKKQTDQNSAETLQGTRLDIYCFILTHNKRVGIREITRELDLSSTSIAQHHLTRLEENGLIKREWSGYVINKIVLQNHIKISRFLIPRTLLYLLFAMGVLLVEFMVYPPGSFQVNIIVLLCKITIITFFAYETLKIRRKKTI